MTVHNSTNITKQTPLISIIEHKKKPCNIPLEKIPCNKPIAQVGHKMLVYVAINYPINRNFGLYDYLQLKKTVLLVEVTISNVI
jgi:hypothetical protein